MGSGWMTSPGGPCHEGQRTAASVGGEGQTMSCRYSRRYYGCLVTTGDYGLTGGPGGPGVPVSPFGPVEPCTQQVKEIDY